MLKIINKEFYWSMNDDNHCTEDITKLNEFFEKTKDAPKIFDKIINHLFDINKESINYLFTKKKSKTNKAIAVTAPYDKRYIPTFYYTINNSYFIGINEKTCKQIDLKNNNVVAFITNFTTDTKIEVYLSEMNFHKYYYKIDKHIPVIVFNLPEYAEERIYDLFYKAFIRLFLNTKCKTPDFYITRKPIINSIKRKRVICESANISEKHYNEWLNGNINF